MSTGLATLTAPQRLLLDEVVANRGVLYGVTTDDVRRLDQLCRRGILRRFMAYGSPLYHLTERGMDIWTAPATPEDPRSA